MPFSRLMVSHFTTVACCLLISAAAATAQQTYPVFSLTNTWDMQALYGAGGHSGLRAFHDVDGDGQNELVTNIGSALDFVALEFDGTEVWRNTIDTTSSKLAYYAKTIASENLIVYGSRHTDTVYGLNLNDGTTRWTHKVSGQLAAIESSSLGAVFGTSTQVGILDYASGNLIPNWPIAYNQHEQILAAGDLTGNGTDEIVLNNNNGNIQVRSADGSLRFQINSTHTHVDLATIADIDPTHAGNELLTFVDDNNNSVGEGDEFALYDMNGNLLRKYEAAAGGANPAVADILPGTPGLEIAFGLENNGTIGLLDGTLNPVFVKQVAGINGGQIGVADLYGDADLEIIANTGENPSAGFQVFDAAGNMLAANQPGTGWDIDPSAALPNGAAGVKQFVDVTGDGIADIHTSRLGADNRTGHEIIHLHSVQFITFPTAIDLSDAVEDINDYNHNGPAGFTRNSGDQGLTAVAGDHFISFSSSGTAAESGSIELADSFDEQQIIQPGVYTLTVHVGDGDIGRDGFTTFVARLQTVGGHELTGAQVIRAYVDSASPDAAAWQQVIVQYVVEAGAPLIGQQLIWAADWTKADSSRAFYGAIDAVTVDYQAIPEPVTALLIGLGAVGVLRRRAA